MKQIKKLGWVLGLIILVAVIMIIRLTSPDLFKQNASAAIDAAQNNANFILAEQVSANSGEFLVVDLNDSEKYNSTTFRNSVNIPFQTLLEKTNLETLKSTSKKIALFSSEISTSAKAWVILNQLNIQNVFILQNSPDEEVLKYKFRPDTVAQPEQVSL